MDARELDEALRNLDRRTSRIEQILPTLSEGLEAVDRHDAAQHGGLKGEIAHVIRRIVRLEAMPGLRQSR